MKENEILVIDTTLDGHHGPYYSNLKSFIKNATFEIIPLEIKNNKLSSIISRYFYLKKIVRISQSYRFVHFLHGDPFYILSPFLLRDKMLKRIVFTIHHLPQNKIKMDLLNLFSKKINRIIVHSEYSKSILRNNGIKNVEVIDYPSFYNYEVKRNKDMTNGKIVLTLLGGTRYDKGIDIFLEALQYLNESVKKQLLINIKGREEYFKKGYIVNILNKNNVKYDIDLNYISDKDFISNVESSDIILLPYRKIFTGNSGPMTEGVSREKCIIGPNEGNIGFLIKKYNLGYTFEAENPKSLALAIENYFKNGWQPSKISREYREKLKLEYFIESHNKLYKKILTELEADK